MSTEALCQALELTLPASAKWLLVCLTDPAQPYRGVPVVDLNIERLAAKTCLAVEEVEAWLMWLRTKGYVREEFQEGQFVFSPAPYPAPLDCEPAPSRDPIPEEDRRLPTAQVRRLVLERDEFKCVQCGATEDLQCDHIYPFSLGGKTVLDNLQTLCRLCNIRKGARVATD